MRPGAYSPKALSVRLSDDAGVPVAGVNVTFEVTTGEATFDRSNTKLLDLTTGANGIATATSRHNEAMSGLVADQAYTGNIRVEVRAAGSSATFTFDQIHSTVAERLEYVEGRDQSIRGPYDVLKPLAVRAVDGDGFPVPGTTVEFVAKDGTANFGYAYPSAAITSGDDGVAATSTGQNYYQVLRSGTSPQGYVTAAEVEARIAGIDAVPFAIPLTPVETIEVVSGDNQEVAGEDYFQPLQVRLKDVDGQNLPYRQTTFNITGEASFMVNGEPLKTYHAASQWYGDVTVPWNTLRANPGLAASGTNATVTVSSGDRLADFHLKIVKQPRAWNLTQVYGGNQTAASGGAFASALGVYARDEQGRYAGYAPVTFEIVSGGGAYFAGSDGARLDSLTVEADRYGHAFTPQLWTGPNPGAFTVTATTPDFAGELIFDLDVVGQPAAIQLYPQTGTMAYPDSSLGWPYAFVTDAEGRPVGNQAVTFKVESGAIGIGRNTDGSEKIRTGVTDSSGMAYAGDALYTGSGKSAYGPAAVSASLTGGLRADATYTVASYPAVKRLQVIEGQGLSARSGEQFGAVTILADSETWPYAGFTDVTFTLEGNTGSYFLDDQGQRTDGPRTVTASAFGYAWAPPVVAGETSGSVTVRASAPGVPDVLVNLSVSGGVSSVTQTSQNGLEAFPEDGFGFLRVQVKDDAGNPVGNEEVNFSVRQGSAEFSNYWWGCSSQSGGRTSVTARTDAFGNASSPVHLCASAGPGSAGDVIVDAATAGVQAEPFTFKVKTMPAATVLSTFTQSLPHVKVGEDLNWFPYVYASASEGIAAGYAEVTYSIEGDTGALFKTTDPLTGENRLEAQVVLRADRWGNLPTPTISAGQTRGTFSLTAKSPGSNELRWDGIRVVGPVASIAAVAGDGQRLYPNNYTTGLRVVARDSDGFTVPNQTLIFRLPSDMEHRFIYNGTTAFSNVTDANGETTPGYSYNNSAIYIGNSAGPFTVTVEHDAQSHAAFNLEALAYPAADTLGNVGGGGQSAQPNAGFPGRLQARVSNQEAAIGIPNVAVNFAIEGSTDAYFVLDNGTRASSALVTSDTAGYVTAPALFAGGQGGSFTVAATADGISSATFDLAVLSSARSLERDSGDGQTEKIGKYFQPLTVLVKDDTGNPVANQGVRFVTETPSRASFGGAFRTYATTDSQGRASSGTITAGTETGPVTISAYSGILAPVNFTLTTEALLTVSELTDATGDGQITVAGTAFPVPLGIRTVDDEGNPAEQVDVTFTLAEGATFAGGASTFTGKSDADGRIYSPLITAGTTSGPLSVVASADGVEPFQFGLTVKAPNAAPQLALTTSATAVEIGDPVMYLLDATDADGDPLSYSIDFGDGAGAQGSYPSSQPISHAYSQAGSYLVYATLRDGINTVSKTARITVILTEPLLPDAGDQQQSVTGQPVTFDAGRSRPAALIHEYGWDFGDGTTGTGLRTQHTYSVPGDYTVSLTVRNGSETATSTTSVKVEQATAVPGLSVTVKSGANLVSGAIVTTNLSDGRRITGTSGSDGIAVLSGLPDGDHSVFVSAGGHLPLVATGTVAGGRGSLTATLASGDIGTSVLETRQLTIEEVRDLGIDPEAPENQQVFESEIHIAVVSSAPTDPEPTPIRVIWNNDDQIGISTNPGEPIYWVGEGSCCVTIGDYDFTPSTVAVGGQRVVQWLIVPTKGSFLKEFFEARLLVQNLASAPFSFTQGQAELVLPQGVSLAPTSGSQAATLPMQDIPGGESRTASWTLRGDVEGEYAIAATYTGVLEPLGEPLRIEATTEKPLKVWGGSALDMEVIVDPSTDYLHPYRVTIKLRNKTPEGAGTTVYNPAFEVLQGSNYLLAPDMEYKKSAASLRPGETLEAEYIFYSRVAGHVGLTDEDLAQSFIVSTGGTVDVDFLPIQEHGGRTDSLDVQAEWIDGPNNSKKLMVGWETVAGVESYTLYSRDDLDNGSWTLVTEGVLAEVPDGRMLDEGSSQLGEYYAVIVHLTDGSTKPSHRMAIATLTPPPPVGPVLNGSEVKDGLTSDIEFLACKDVLFIGAAGSGEDLMGANVARVATKLKESLLGKRTFAALQLDYDAAAVPVAGGDWSVSIPDYFRSIDGGVEELKTFLAVRQQKGCVHEKYVLAGYSQGALSMSRAVEESSAFLPKEKVAGIALIANASNHWFIGGNREGSALTNLGVSSALWSPTIPGAVAPVTHSICDWPDLVCDARSDALTGLALSFIQGYRVHTSYHKEPARLDGFAKRTGDLLLGVPVPRVSPFTLTTGADEQVSSQLELKPLEGVTAKWAVTSSTAPAGSTLTVSESGRVEGKAPAGFWTYTLAVEGNQDIQKRAGLTLEVRSGWAAMAAQVNPITTVAPGTVLKPLSLRVLDANGNPVPGAEVEFRIDGPASFADGSKSYKVRTDAQGYAVSTTPIPTGASGTVTAEGEVPGQPPVVLPPQDVVAQQGLPQGVSANVTPRFVSGKVALEVAVANASGEAKAVTLSSRYGSKNLGSLLPGASVTHLFATGQKLITQGSVLVTAKGAVSSGSQSIAYAAYNPAAELKLENASSPETRTAGSVFAPYAVRLVRGDGTSVVGATVTFDVIGPARFGDASSTTAVTDASGYAVTTTPLRAGAEAGAVSATATTTGTAPLSLPERTVTLPSPEIDIRSTVHIKAVNGKIFIVGTAENRGNTAVDITIQGRYGKKTLLAVAPGATVSHSFATGLTRTTAGSLTFAAVAGALSSEAKTDYPAAGPGLPALLQGANEDAQSVLIGQPFVAQRVRVLDSVGAPVANVTVRFDVAGTAAFAGGSLSATGTTDAQGWAVSAADLFAGPLAGTARLTADVPGVAQLVLTELTSITE
ncbi:PKD repeat protein [Arthrobacter sp. UYEF6]